MLEIVAVIFTLLSVFLTRTQNILCWIAGIIGTGCYFFIFKADQSWANMILQILFILQALHGLYTWKRQSGLVAYWGSDDRIGYEIATLMFAIAASYAAILHFDLKMSLLDVATTLISMFALYLTAIKRIESWVYWASANVLYIIFFASNQHWLSTGLYVIFLINTYFGYKAWKKYIIQPTY